ncbi:hypothetical protein Q0P64_14155, partial [Staphylococcus aureus]|nr:hypothetical protein [Staphylococcus aureus]
IDANIQGQASNQNIMKQSIDNLANKLSVTPPPTLEAVDADASATGAVENSVPLAPADSTVEAEQASAGEDDTNGTPS